MTSKFLRLSLVIAVVLGLAAVLPVAGFQPAENSRIAGLQFRAPELDVSELSAPSTSFSDATVRARVRAVALPGSVAQLDLRTGRFATLLTAVPLLPGKGVGNNLEASAEDLALRGKPAELGMRAWQALRPWLVANRAALGIDPAELVDAPRVTVIHPDFIQIHSPRRVAGLPVRGAFLSATIRYGNLVLLGTSHWGDVEEFAIPRLTELEASASLQRFVAPFDPGTAWKASELVWLPVATATTLAPSEIGAGIAYKLAWVVRGTFGEADGRYEALVDATDGTVLALEDTRQFVATTRTIEGGVLPVSNDGINPDGIEQPDWPMPFSNVSTPGGVVTTDVGGNLPVCVDGSISSSLSGPFMVMSDNCGAVNLSGTGSLDFGVSAGTDCVTPGVGGAGNTHASRTGFFELNQLKSMSRGQLPNNLWLLDPLTSNMNINSTCNAFWNGSSVNFYRSGGGCFNTGELAGVFDHEWGHGMDNNDANPSISNPGEGIADIYASLRLDDSCIGRHFTAGNCGGYGNPCTSCTGIREIDWAKHTANTPLTLANADATCGGGPAPCGGIVHCEGQVYSQAVWDLWNRDLVGAPLNLGLDVAREIATQLTYRGASNVSSWYSCTNGTGGCGNPNGCGCVATTGYMNYLVADDDNGNLADGTPHMGAIFAAFNRHGIACTVPTVTTAGCSRHADGGAGGDADRPRPRRGALLDRLDRGVQLPGLSQPGRLRLFLRQGAGGDGHRHHLHRPGAQERARLLLPGRAHGGGRRVFRGGERVHERHPRGRRQRLHSGRPGDAADPRR